MEEQGLSAINIGEIKGGRKPVIIKKALVIVNLLNIRKEPSLNSQILGTLKKNDTVEFFALQDGWAKLKYNDGVAYVVQSYIKALDDSGQKGVVTQNNVNFRKGPSMNDEIIRKLMQNEVVPIYGQESGFYLIEHQSTIGYISNQFIKIQPDAKSAMFFYQREDLVSLPLEPVNKITSNVAGAQKITADMWNKYGNLLGAISRELMIDVASAMCVLCVESGGSGFGADGKMIIRFENHLFYSFWGKNNLEKFNQHFQFSPTRVWEGHMLKTDKDAQWKPVHTGAQSAEWEAFEFAKSLDSVAAMKSISIGMPQVMGFNYNVIGYQNIEQMFQNFNKDVRYHIFALFDFCKVQPVSIEYLRKLDFASFAYIYNGPGQTQYYGNSMMAYYNAFKSLNVVV